jgi:hypothetical protein
MNIKLRRTYFKNKNQEKKKLENGRDRNREKIYFPFGLFPFRFFFCRTNEQNGNKKKISNVKKRDAAVIIINLRYSFLISTRFFYSILFISLSIHFSFYSLLANVKWSTDKLWLLISVKGNVSNENVNAGSRIRLFLLFTWNILTYKTVVRNQLQRIK